MDVYSSTSSYFTHYSSLFSASQTSHNTIPIKTNLTTDRAPTKHRDYFRGLQGIFLFKHMRQLGFPLGPLRVFFVGVHFKHRSVKRAVLQYPLSACYSYPCRVRFQGLILVGDYSLCPLRVTLGLLWLNSWPTLVNPE